MRKTNCDILCCNPWIILAVLLAGILLTNNCATNKSAVGDISDAEIRDVVARVAKHQIKPLADGDFAAVKSVQEVKSANPPEGIAWNYPWGVTLFGMQRAAEVTGDVAGDNFVVQHNLTCARYYAWLAALKASVTNSTEISAFARHSKLKVSGIQISGLPEQPIEDVRLENIRLTSKGGGTAEAAAIQPKELGNGYPEPKKIGTLPAYGIFARHVQDLELANIHMNFQTNDLRPAMMFADVHGLEIDNIKPQTAEGVKAAVFADEATDLVIRNSPALESVK